MFEYAHGSGGRPGLMYEGAYASIKSYVQGDSSAISLWASLRTSHDLDESSQFVSRMLSSE